MNNSDPFIDKMRNIDMLENKLKCNKELYQGDNFLLNVHMDKNIDKYSQLLINIKERSDKDSFIELFSHFAPRIKSYLIGTGCSPEIAEEVTQESMLNVWRKASLFNPEKALASTWIYTIARNKKIDALRKIKKNQPDLNDPHFVNESENPDDKIEKVENSQIILKAIKELPKDQAIIVHKNFFEDKSHIEISKELDIPLGTVKSRMRLAIKKLRTDIKKSIVK